MTQISGNTQRAHQQRAQHGEFAEFMGYMLRKPRALTPLILLMGFIGASLRYVLESALPVQGGFPFATLAVNIFGCFVLEIVNQYVGRRMHLPAPLVKSLGVGLIGAFTTIAAFSTECVGFFQSGQFALAAIYIGTTIATTFLSALAGRYASQYLTYRRLQRMRARRNRESRHLNEDDNEEAQQDGGER